MLCGDPENTDEGKRGTIKGDVFGSPDGLWFDGRGVLWIQTDVSTSVLHNGDYARMGSNQMLVNIQHPGETPSERSDPKNPTAISAWPDGSGRPRSETIVIQRRDGGVIGA